ncbi:unnamed protein product [Effrenium voratum]|nr:unnamed protein product [Effrenium voratum]
MRRPDVRKGRHCIRPELSRSFTFGEEGVSGGQFFKAHLGKIKLNEVMVDWSKQDLTHLASAQAFDDYLTEQLHQATPATLETVDSFAAKSQVLRIEYEDAKYKAKIFFSPAKKSGKLKESVFYAKKQRRAPYRWSAAAATALSGGSPDRRHGRPE